MTRSPSAPWPQPPELSHCHRVLAAALGCCPTRDARMVEPSSQPGRWVQPSHLQVTPKPPGRSRGVRDLGPPQLAALPQTRHRTAALANDHPAGGSCMAKRSGGDLEMPTVLTWLETPSVAVPHGSSVPDARFDVRLCQRSSCQPGAESCHLWVAENDYRLFEWSRREADNCISPHSLRRGMEWSNTGSPRRAGTAAGLSPQSHVLQGSRTVLHQLLNPLGVGCILLGCPSCSLGASPSPGEWHWPLGTPGPHRCCGEPPAEVTGAGMCRVSDVGWHQHRCPSTAAAGRTVAASAGPGVPHPGEVGAPNASGICRAGAAPAWILGPPHWLCRPVGIVCLARAQP